MAEGRVTATSLNLREAPSGAVVGVLPNGTAVSVLDTQSGWLRVSASIAGQTRFGWVSAAYVSIAGAPAPTPAAAPTAAPAAIPAAVPAAPSAIPPPDDDAHPVTVADGKAIGPDGNWFARASGPGFFTYGITTLVDWLKTNAAPAGITDSVVRTVRAVSLNEGKLEAINSYDSAFLSFGLLQWTAGTDNSAGELAALLDRVKRTEPNAFQQYFAAYGLDVALPAAISTTGTLLLNGAALNSAADKEQLRAAAWCYRLWRAGHDDAVRRCELVHGASRIQQFLEKPVNGRAVAEWLTSEYGIALVLDEHVNRPGHVPGTLGTAIEKLPPDPDPTQWGDADEARLIDLYIDARNQTNITNPQLRAANITGCMHDRTLSDARGSFVAAPAAGV